MTEQPIWTWPLEGIQRITTQAHAGADLTPDVWPNGARVAVALSFDFDGETSWLYRGERSSAAMSRGEYGARVGIYRILALLAQYEVSATFFVPAVNGQLHPEAIDAILLKMLETLIKEIKATPGVWFATHEAVGRFVRAEATERG